MCVVLRMPIGVSWEQKWIFWLWKIESCTSPNNQNGRKVRIGMMSLSLTSFSKTIKYKLGEIFIRLIFTFYITSLFKRNSISPQKNMSGSTNWIDIIEKDQLSSQYNITWNQPNVIKDPSLRAKLILESWITIDNESRNAFLSIITNLLRISNLFDSRQESNQEISKTVYVMY